MVRELTSMAVAMLLVAAPPAPADADDAPPRRLIVARERALWRIEENGSRDPVKVVDLGADAAAVTRIEPGKGGRYVLVELGQTIGYAVLGNKPGKLKPLPCASSARMSPDGLCVGCLDKAGQVTVIRLADGKVSALGKLGARQVGFASRTELVITTATEIAGVALTGSHKRRRLASEAPAGDLLIAPNGQRAVARYGGDGDDAAVYGFKLDGRAARRKLAGNSVPRAWSADSAWVVLQSNDQVCVARAVGGEYKCWEGFVGLGVDLAAENVLMARSTGTGHELFRAPIAGARATTPQSIATVASAAGAWLP